MPELISIEEQQNITAQLDLYLKTTFKDKAKKARATLCERLNPQKNFRIMARRSNVFDIYIRFDTGISNKQAKTLTIARIYFTKTLKKSGAQLLYQLTIIAKQYSYKFIVIERVNDSSRAFAKRFNFNGCGFHDENNGHSNYIIAISELEPLLKDYLKLRPS